MYPDFFKLSHEWTSFFYNDEMEEMISEISENVISDKTFPETENIFRCFYLTPFENVNVVFIDKEPYHNGSATGLCLDIKLGHIINHPIQTIYKEIESEGFYPTKNGNFEHLSAQGVLMLNTSLTVEKGKPGSHIEFWLPFFKKVIKKLSTKNNIIWVFFVDDIKDASNIISNDNHIIINRNEKGMFKLINQLLAKIGKEKISW